MTVYTPRARNLAFWLASVFFISVLIGRLSHHILPFAGDYLVAQPSHRSSSSRPLDIRERMARSERIWQRSIEERIRVRQQIPQNDIPAHGLFPGQRLPTATGHDGPYYTIWDFFPPTYTCPWDVQRIGRFADGGKWVCGMSKYEKSQDIIVYSFGVEQDSAFEDAVLSRTDAHIFAYDFSVSSFGPQIQAKYQNRTQFNQIGFGARDEPDKQPPFFTLKSLMARNGHDYIDILKMDVEGAEIAGLSRFMDDFEGSDLPIGQLLIEIHLLNDSIPQGFQQFSDWWERLEAFGLRATWLEINLIGVTLTSPAAPSGHEPRWAEVVFVNVKDPRSVLWEE